MMEKTRMYIFRNLEPEVSPAIRSSPCIVRHLHFNVAKRFWAEIVSASGDI